MRTCRWPTWPAARSFLIASSHKLQAASHKLQAASLTKRNKGLYRTYESKRFR